MGNNAKPQTFKSLNEACGGIGNPSKMPGYAWGTSAESCVTGSKLAKIPGTICSVCYAMRANYQYPSVKKAHAKREETLKDLTKWTDAMVELIDRRVMIKPPAERYFRFHDSGDLQSIEHLDAICQVAIRSPGILFWLPTREYGMVRNYAKHHDIPRNLVIRLSAIRVDEAPPYLARKLALPTSTVGHNMGFQCPARKQGNECGSCRKCWDARETNVNYEAH